MNRFDEAYKATEKPRGEVRGSETRGNVEVEWLEGRGDLGAWAGMEKRE